MGVPPDLPGMVEVELVDDDGAAGPRAGRRRRAERVPPRTWRGRPALRRVLAAGAALAVAGAGLAVLTRDAGVAVDLRPVAAPDLSLPPQVRWSMVQQGSGWTIAADLLTTVRRDGDAFVVTAVDLATGTTRWTTEVPSDAATGVACPALAEGTAGPLLVCRARGGLGTSDDPATPGERVPGRLVLLDAADGAVVGERTLGTGPVALAGLEGDLVVASAEHGATVLERLDLARGQVVWSTSLRRGPASTGGLHRLRVAHGRVVHTGARHTVLDATDGRVLGSWPVDRGRGDAVGDVVLAAHGFGVRLPGDDGAPTTLWHGPGGTRSVLGAPVEPLLGDGSEPDVVLTRDTAARLVGHVGDDAAWRLPLDGQVPVVRAAGRVVLAGGGSLRAVDVRTGHVLWRTDAAGLERSLTVSDGRVLLVTGLVPGTGYAVSAVSLTDGSLLWRVAMPPGTTTVELHGGRLVATGAGALAGLG